ncbi:MAG: tRNA (N6-threonylcarbamoyladenosine(37)-N6)-methyltransferase TrmO [Anaerolineaceae bacterium]|nr:tRNA (N6-threonylcarbamoyladenosine(37)-N6)-methyltransferase TrmO [Anaerolineaceae bacterium]
MEFTMQAIGVIHTPFQDKAGMPIQSARSDVAGTVEVFPPYLEGLDGIEEFSHCYLLYGLHRSDACTALKVRPFLDDKLHGVFATRYPVRPNPLGISVVRLAGRRENVLDFTGADMLDGTPLLDIKPYIPEFDIFTVEKTGWYRARKYS